MRANLQSTAAATGLTTTLSDFYELTKPSIVWLILMSTLMGFYLATTGPMPYALLVNTVIATSLLAGGTGALNQWWERSADARMRRTLGRPLPAGRIQPATALVFSIGLSIAGLAYLYAATNALSFSLGVFVLVAYNLVYTPLKFHVWWSTFIGAFPGAAPPLLGWTAASNELSIEGWALFGVLFLWQFPHFYAIAWMYREDYDRAGIRMLPVVEPDGVSTGRQIIAYSLALIPVSMAPAWLGMASVWFAVPAFLLSAGYLYYGILLARKKTRTQARSLLRASVLYLPLLYLFLLIFKA